MSEDGHSLTPGDAPPQCTLRPIVHVTVAWHPNQARIGDRVLLSGSALALARTVGVLHAPGRGSTGPLADPFVSRAPIVFEALGDELRITPPRRVTVMGQAGQVRVDSAALDRGVAVNIRDRVLLWVDRRVPRTAGRGRCGMVGRSGSLDAVRDEIGRVGRTNSAVLIRGEHGVGKSMVAHAIHLVSGRSGPFHTVDFREPGEGGVEDWLSASSGGTLFLRSPELASSRTQRTLLDAAKNSDRVRLVASTMGAQDSPLISWLGRSEISVAPLRDRPADIGPLMSHFLGLELEAQGASRQLNDPGEGPAWMSALLVERALGHRWSGNVRELWAFARAIVEHGADRQQVDPEAFRETLG